MEIKSIAEAKKTLQVEYDKFLTKPKENEYYRAGLQFAVAILGALEKSVREKLFDRHSGHPPEMSEDSPYCDALREVLGEEK